MRKNGKSFILVVLVALVLLLATSCYSTIGLRTLVPAEVNVAGYKTIAVQTTSYNYSPVEILWRNYLIPVRGTIDETYLPYVGKIFTLFESTTPEKVKNYASKNLTNAIDKGFFTVNGPELTDALILVGKNTGTVRQTLLNNKVDALLSSNISYMYYDEYVTAEPIYGDKADTKKITGYNFFIVQNATINLTYTVTDVEDNVLIANKTQALSLTDYKTHIGHTDPSDIKKYVQDTASYDYVTATDIFDYLVKEILADVTNQLTPHYTTTYIDLMLNKPKAEAVKNAYSYVDSGNYQIALEMFLKEYKTSGHIPSGYNAAVLYYALGDYDNAFDLSYEVYNKSGNSNALELYYTLKNIKDKDDAAIAQINGEKRGTSATDELIGF